MFVYFHSENSESPFLFNEPRKTSRHFDKINLKKCKTLQIRVGQEKRNGNIFPVMQTTHILIKLIFYKKITKTSTVSELNFRLNFGHQQLINVIVRIFNFVYYSEFISRAL